MPNQKARLTKSLDLLTQEVQDVTALAKSQRQNADMEHDSAIRQHENARKLEAIGELLDANASGLKAELKKI